MEYAQGTLGRVFAARLHDGEPVYQAIEDLAEREGVESAAVFLVGGAARGKIVTGPKDTEGPLEPIIQEFDDTREMMGVGTLHRDDEGPSLHLHAGFGREDSALVGCPRVNLEVFLVLEVFIIEVKGLDAERALDPVSGLRLLKFAAPTVLSYGAGETPS
jgi:predicted DNA-binding protein with PD1-like motif